MAWQVTAAVGTAVLLVAVATFLLWRRQSWRDSLTLSIVGWVFLAVLIAAGTAGALLWLLGWPTLPRSAAFTTAETLDLLKIALAVVAGFGGVVLLSVNHRRQRFAEKAHELAENLEEREEAKLYNDRFGAAAEQLAHERATVRLAGVYALAGLADDWDAGRQQCVELLVAYLRLAQSEERAPGVGEEEVVGTILRVFRDRLSTQRGVVPGPWSRLDFDFTGMTFTDANFGGLHFNGTVTFDGVRFDGEQTSFANTVFAGVLSCHGTEFAAARTDFRWCTFSGRTEFVGTRFTGQVDLSGATVNGGDVDFYRCPITDRIDLSLLSVRRGTVRFDQCELTDARLVVAGPLLGSIEGRSAEYASLSIVNCSAVRSGLVVTGATVANGRLVITDLTLRNGLLRVTVLESRHPSLYLRHIHAVDSTVEVPVREHVWRAPTPEHSG